MDIKYQTATPKSICDQRLFTGSLLNEMTAMPLASSSFSWKKRRNIRENSAMFGLGTAKKLRFDGFLCPKKVVWSGVLKQEKLSYFFWRLEACGKEMGEVPARRCRLGNSRVTLWRQNPRCPNRALYPLVI